jgi:hypothetical protein
MTWKDQLHALFVLIEFVLVLITAFVIGVYVVTWIVPLPEPPAVQYSLTVYRYMTTEQSTIDGTLQYTSVRLDLGYYTDYSPLACDEIIPDDNGHTCYVSDPLGISVVLEDNHIKR